MQRTIRPTTDSDLQRNHCLPLRFPLMPLFGSEEVPDTWKYNVSLCGKVNILAERKTLPLYPADALPGAEWCKCADSAVIMRRTMEIQQIHGEC